MIRRELIAGLGSAAAWPLVARAQRPAKTVIGYLGWGPLLPNSPYIGALRAGLADAGFIEGKNLSIEYRSGYLRQLQEMAADLVGRRVAVIVAHNNLGPIGAAKGATSTIPIVFVYAGDRCRTVLLLVSAGQVATLRA